MPGRCGRYFPQEDGFLRVTACVTPGSNTMKGEELMPGYYHPAISDMQRDSMQVSSRALRFATVIFMFLMPTIAVAGSEYPAIEELNNSDVLFRQLQNDISEFHRSRGSENGPPPLSFFRYELRDNDTFLRVASRLTLPQATIASLNGLREARFPSGLKEIVIPNQPGVFAPLDPESDLEYMLSGRVDPEELEIATEEDPDPEMRTPEDPAVSDERTVGDEGVRTRINTRGTTREFHFFAGDDFTAEERRAFLGILFRAPLSQFRISSPFGSRPNPFTGRMSFHTGLDMAAPHGTPVRAVREGTVVDADNDRVYGKYVIIEHDRVFTTFYGHMNEIRVDLGDTVQAGTVVGSVGNTGLSTGPHLHFEVRVRGEARDPAQFIPGS